MLFKRAQITSYGNELVQRAAVGSGVLDNVTIAVAPDSATTLTVTQMSGGAIVCTPTAGRSYTTPTAALILASAPDMDIGDSFAFTLSVLAAFAITWVAGSNVTLAGRPTVPASSNATIIVTKTSATTVTWTSL